MQNENQPESAALRERREAVIGALSAHFTNDALSMDEYERRVDRAHRAMSVGELDALLADLDPSGGTGGSGALVKKAATPETAVARRDTRGRRVLSVLGSTQRKGTWRVPRTLPVVSVLSGMDLDFREAELGPGVTEVKVTNVLSGIAIIVPPHLAVECEGAAILSNFEGLEQRGASSDPDAPLLRITGVSVLGSVEIATRRAGEPMKADPKADVGEMGKRQLPPGG